MTLTQAALFTRRGIIAFLILVALIIISLIGYRIWHTYYLSTLPPVEEKPDLKFGSLPEIILPAVKVSSSNYAYTLDTTTGDFPQVPKVMKVYFLPRSGVMSLLAPEKSAKLAENLGFNITPQVVSPTIYRFTNQNKDDLFVDLITGNFKMARKISTASAKTTLPAGNNIVEIFKSYLSQRGLLPPELANGRSKVASATASLWPQDVDKLIIVTANNNTSLVTGTYAGKKQDKDDFSQIYYTYWPIDLTTFATYPIITPAQAFENLKTGKGFITLESDSSQVSIASISLAYYQSEEYSPYMQPVYLFEGLNFAAIVPAIQK